MRENHFKRVLMLAACLALSTHVRTARAGALEVAPTTIDIPNGSQSAILYIANRGTKPAIAQIEGFDWKQNGNDDELTPTTALMFSPPLVKLSPGQQQIVRLAIKPDKQATQERSFRLVVSELPNPADAHPHEINMLLQFSVPVFAEGPDESTQALQWNAAKNNDGLVLSAHNISPSHSKLSGVQLVSADGTKTAAQPTAFCYILPGASHQWTVASSEAKKQSLHVEAYDEKEGASINVPLPSVP